MGTSIEVWDPGDPPQGREVWDARWAAEMDYEAPAVEPTPRIRAFAALYEQRLREADIDLAEHLPEMLRDGEFNWYFDGPVVGVGKFLGPRADEVCNLATAVAREVGAVPFVGLDEEVPDGWAPVYQPAEQFDYSTRTWYVAVPELARDVVGRRAGWVSNQIGALDPRLGSFIDRLTASLAAIAVLEGAPSGRDVLSRDGLAHEVTYRHFTHHSLPGPKDWHVLQLTEGAQVLALSGEQSSGLMAAVNAAIHEVKADLTVIDENENQDVDAPSVYFPWFYLVPEGLFGAVPTVDEVESLRSGPPNQAALTLIEAMAASLATLDLLPRESISASLNPAYADPQVIFDPPLGSMDVTIEPGGDIVKVLLWSDGPTIDDTIRTVGAGCPPGCVLFTTDAGAAKLLPNATLIMDV